jgi:hypothetical protein
MKAFAAPRGLQPEETTDNAGALAGYHRNFRISDIPIPRNLAYGAEPLCRTDCDLIAVHCAAHLKPPGLSFCLIIYLVVIRLFRKCKMICVYDDHGSKKVTRMPHLFYDMQPGVPLISVFGHFAI